MPLNETFQTNDCHVSVVYKMRILLYKTEKVPFEIRARRSEF